MRIVEKLRSKGIQRARFQISPKIYNIFNFLYFWASIFFVFSLFVHGAGLYTRNWLNRTKYNANNSLSYPLYYKVLNNYNCRDSFISKYFNGEYSALHNRAVPLASYIQQHFTLVRMVPNKFRLFCVHLAEGCCLREGWRERRTDGWPRKENYKSFYEACCVEEEGS